MTRLLAAALTALTLSTAAAHAECRVIEFAPGTNSAQVHATSYHALTECFFLRVRPGQAAHVRIIGGTDTTFDTPETGPDQIDTSFLLQSNWLEVYISKGSAYPDRENVIVEFTID
ncbi:hypothetical protein [Nioella sp.]|uniref:hypothetical protein n=1 Tax=Nioella sp. TaxID=1912091 RepID=UPI003B51DAE8